MRNQRRAQPAAIQISRPLGGDRVVGAGEVGLAQHRPERDATLGIDPRPVGVKIVAALELRLGVVERGDIVVHQRKSLVRQGDCRGEDLGEGLAAVAAHQLAPARQIARRAAGDRAARQLLAAGELPGRKRARHARDEVQRAHAPLRGDVAGRHPHAGQAGHIGLDHVQRSGGRGGRIERVAAGAQHRRTGLRRLRMCRRDDPAQGGNRRSPAVHHAPLPVCARVEGARHKVKCRSAWCAG